MGVLAAGRRLDDRVLADPVRFLPRALAAAGLAYVFVGGGYWLVSVLSFAHQNPLDRLLALSAFPWSGLPLLVLFWRPRPRAVGLLVAAGALTQLAIAWGSWGLEFAYLPLVALGLLLLVVPTGEAST